MIKAIENLSSKNIVEAIRTRDYYRKNKTLTISESELPQLILACSIKNKNSVRDFTEIMTSVAIFLKRVTDGDKIPTEEIESAIEETQEKIIVFNDEKIVNGTIKDQTRYRALQEKIKEENKRRSEEAETEEEEVDSKFLDAFSEMKIAEDFCKHIDGEYIFNLDTKQWHRWNGKVWEIDNRTKIQGEYTKFSTCLFEILKEISDPAQNKAAYKRIVYFNSRQGMDNVITLAGRKLKCLNEDFNINDNLLNVRNGTIEFLDNDFSFRPHKKEDMISYICNVDYIPDDPVPKIWINHIEKIMRKDAKLIENIQYIFGYVLQGGNPLEKILICNGAGRNGKSVTLRTICYILGNYSEEINPIILMENGNKVNSPERIRMRGKRFILAQETRKQEDNVKDSFTLDSGFLKAASGKDKISLRNNHSNVMEEFYIKGLINLSTNNLPRIHDNTISFWDRLWMLPFHYYFPEEERDYHMDMKLREVANGIFNWCLQGWKNSKGSFDPADAVKDLIQDYQEDSDEYSIFLKDCIERKNNAAINASDFFLRYKAWCTRRNRIPVSETIFGNDMKNRFARKRNSMGNVYMDIEMKENWI
jgi:P4 family phage/plasmid primase-like protien